MPDANLLAADMNVLPIFNVLALFIGAIVFALLALADTLHRYRPLAWRVSEPENGLPIRVKYYSTTLDPSSGKPAERNPVHAAIYYAREADGRISEWVCMDTGVNPPAWELLGYVQNSKSLEKNFETLRGKI